MNNTKPFMKIRQFRGLEIKCAHTLILVFFYNAHALRLPVNF